MQFLISLFTSGGKINPIAILLLIAVTFYGFDEWLDYRDKLSLARQCDVIQGASRQRLDTLNEVRNEQQQANKLIDSDGYDSFLDKLQHDN